MMMLGFSAGLIPKNINIARGYWVEPLILYILCIADHDKSMKTKIFDLFATALEDLETLYAPLDKHGNVMPFMIGDSPEVALKTMLCNDAQVFSGAAEYLDLCNYINAKAHRNTYRGTLTDLWSGSMYLRNFMKKSVHYGIVAITTLGAYDSLYHSNSEQSQLFARFVTFLVQPITDMILINQTTTSMTNLPSCFDILYAVYTLLQTLPKQSNDETVTFTLLPDAEDLFLDKCQALRDILDTSTNTDHKYIISKAGSNIYNIIQQTIILFIYLCLIFLSCVSAFFFLCFLAQLFRMCGVMHIILAAFAYIEETFKLRIQEKKEDTWWPVPNKLSLHITRSTVVYGIHSTHICWFVSCTM